MSIKKDRFNFRRWNKRGRHVWGVPSSWKRSNKMTARRYLRARTRQRIREGKYDQLPWYKKDAGYNYY